MIGDNENKMDEQDGDDDATDTAIDEAPAPKNVDNVGDLSVEINVEELVAKIESDDTDQSGKDQDIRRKLDEMETKRKKELDSTYNFNLDDDL